MCYWQTAGHCLYVPKNKGIEDKDIQQSSHGHISVVDNIGIEYKQPDFRVLAQHPEHTASMLSALWNLLRLSVAAADFIFWGSAFVNSFCFFCYLHCCLLLFHLHGGLRAGLKPRFPAVSYGHQQRLTWAESYLQEKGGIQNLPESRKLCLKCE